MAYKRLGKDTLQNLRPTEKIKDAKTGLSVPDEVWKSCTWMTVLGRGELTIEGHEGILNYETDCVQVRLKQEILHVAGRGLTIDYYNDEELKIIGWIEQIRWGSR